MGSPWKFPIVKLGCFITNINLLLLLEFLSTSWKSFDSKLYLKLLNLFLILNDTFIVLLQHYLSYLISFSCLLLSLRKEFISDYNSFNFPSFYFEKSKHSNFEWQLVATISATNHELHSAVSLITAVLPERRLFLIFSKFSVILN